MFLSGGTVDNFGDCCWFSGNYIYKHGKVTINIVETMSIVLFVGFFSKNFLVFCFILFTLNCKEQ